MNYVNLGRSGLKVSRLALGMMTWGSAAWRPWIRSEAEAAANLEPFEDAYARADWSRFERLPLFRAANRMNAYNTYLLMEQEAK